MILFGICSIAKYETDLSIGIYFRVFKVIVKVGRNLHFNIGVVSYDRPVNQVLYSKYKRFLYTFVSSKQFKISKMPLSFTAIITIVATLSSVIIICVVVLSFRMFYDHHLARELKAAGLQRFQEGNIDSINPHLPLGAQADLLPVK